MAKFWVGSLWRRFEFNLRHMVLEGTLPRLSERMHVLLGNGGSCKLSDFGCAREICRLTGDPEEERLLRREADVLARVGREVDGVPALPS